MEYKIINIDNEYFLYSNDKLKINDKFIFINCEWSKCKPKLGYFICTTLENKYDINAKKIYACSKKLENLPKISKKILDKKIIKKYGKIEYNTEYIVKLDLEFQYIECHNYNGKHLNKDCSCKSGNFKNIYKPYIEKNKIKIFDIEK